MTEFGTAGKGELMAGYTMTSKEGLRIGGTLILSGNADTSDVLSGKEFYTTDPKTKKRGTLALSGSATAADVLAGKTFYNTDAKSKQGGQMADNGDWSATLAPGGSITVPPGKHSGGGQRSCQAIKDDHHERFKLAARIPLNGVALYADRWNACRCRVA